MTGMGWWFGEGGGAGDLVMEALRQIIREWSRRGPATALTPVFMERAGTASLDEFVEQVCLEIFPADASLARRVFQIAAGGDAVACQVIGWAAHALAEMANGVIRQLEIEGEEFPVVLAGSLFDGGSLLVEPLRAEVHSIAPRAEFLRLKALPVVGAVLLAMEQVGLHNPAVRRRLANAQDRSAGTE
jgi:N-acetylglucosamine kinase-like BadF-type ATPase